MSVFPHPWKALRELDTVAVSWRDDLPSPVHAVTNGRNIIWMAKNLLQVERRCAIQHEQAHIDLGHTNCDDPREEQAARRLTAQKLIAWDALVDVFKWAHTAFEAADELWVTPEVLEDRLRFLRPHEKGLLRLIGASRHA